MELITAFSYLVVELCLRRRLGGKSERKCSYVRSCCFLSEKKHRCYCTLVVCL